MKTRAKIFTLIISFIMLASTVAVIPAGAATVDSNYSKVTEASLCLNSYSLADEIENSIPGSTITLEADVSLTEPLVIGEDQLVSINLNGHNITAEGTAVINNGFLLLCGEGSIIGDGVNTIINNGTLAIDGKDIIFDVDVNPYIFVEYIALKGVDGKYYILENSNLTFEPKEVDGVELWSLDGVVYSIKVEGKSPEFLKTNDGELFISQDGGETWSVVNYYTPPALEPDDTEKPENNTPEDNSGETTTPDDNKSEGSDNKDDLEEEKAELDSDYVFVIVICSMFLLSISIAAIAGFATRRRYF